MSRHPYTHAADFIREIIGPEFSRSQASQLNQKIADALGMSHFDFSVKLSNKFQKNHVIVEEKS